MSNNENDEIIVNGHMDSNQELVLATDLESNNEKDDFELEASSQNDKEEISKAESLDLESPSQSHNKDTAELKNSSFADVDTESQFFDDFLEIFDSELSEVLPKKEAFSEPPQLAKQELLRFEEALDLKGKIESVVFASAKPVKSSDIKDILHSMDDSLRVKDIEKCLSSLMQEYQERAGGFRLVNLKGMGYQFQTCAAAAPIMERLFSSRPRPLSRAALETLSVIAYRQPVTRADIEFIRGVDAGSIIKNLLDRELIACVGRKEDSGRPMLFGTTKEFLKVFSLDSLSELPPLAAFQPSAEVVGDALKKLNGEEEVDVEGFVGDESRVEPSVGNGLSVSQQSDLFNDEQDHANLRQGAVSVVEEEISFDGESQNSEVVISDGDNLEKASGEVD